MTRFHSYAVSFKCGLFNARSSLRSEKKTNQTREDLEVVTLCDACAVALFGKVREELPCASDNECR
jgi:hypothetical protein